MKRFIKTLCLLLTMVLSLGFVGTLTACEDIKQLEVNMSLYNTETNQQIETTLTVDLYRHLAPDTVDKIIEYAEKGYYNDTIFYKNVMYTNIMVGDYKVVDKELVRNQVDYTSTVNGEFIANGLKMDGEFKFTEGTIGLWRDWQATGDYKNNNDEAFNSGVATMFITAENKSDYDGYFCAFGKIDTPVGSTNETAFRTLKAITASSTHYVGFTTYYTGDVTINEDGSVDYSTLTYHQMLTSEFNEKYDDENKTIDGEVIFEAEDLQFISYNKQSLQLPVSVAGNKINAVYAKIVSVNVVE